MTSISYRQAGSILPVIPMLYSAFIALILLYAYTGALAVYVLPVFFFTYTVFRFCGYCKRANPRSYYIGLLAALTPVLYLLLYNTYDVPLVLWLFSPFPPSGYTGYFLIVLIFACFFIPSAVFYFTAVIYRAPVHLLLLIVAYVANYRRGVEVPAVFAALTAGLFFAVMLFSGNPEFKDSSWRVKNRFIYAFAAAVVIAAGFASLINVPMRELPVPQEYRGTNFAGLLGYSQSSGNAGFNEPSDRIIFLVEAEEPIYFIRQVFGNYSGLRWWLPEDEELDWGFYSWERIAASLNYDDLFALLRAAGEPVAGLEYIEGAESRERAKTATIFPQDAATRYIPAPVRTFEVLGLPNWVQCIRNKLDEIFIMDGKSTNPRSSYTIRYYSDIFTGSDDFQNFARHYDDSQWPALLDKLYQSYMYTDEAYAYMLLNFIVRQNEAAQYAECANGYRSVKMRQLAEEITEGCDGVYERAKAIERYFHESGYTYDLEYNRENDDMEYFLFEGKTGICGHYATAMTLMARMVGLNARYVEGFASTEQNGQGQYVIREANSHAFVQVHVPAYGWVTFDPTAPGDRPSAFMRIFASVRDALGSNMHAVFAFVSLLILLGFAGHITYVFVIEEMLFRRTAGHSDDGIVLLYRRVLKLAQKRLKADNLSAGMLSRLIYDAYGVHIEVITDGFERTAFGNGSVSREEKEAALAAYKELCIKTRKSRPYAVYPI